MAGYGRPKAVTTYGRIANAEANPIQQIVMLYDGAIKFLRLAASDIEANDIPAKAEHTGRALDIVTYLQSTLDYQRGGEVAPALNELYAHVISLTLRASAALDATMMRRAADLMAPVRDAWETNARASATLSLTASASQAPAAEIRQLAVNF